MLVSVPRIFTRIYDGLNKRMREEGGLTKIMFDRALANAHKQQELAATGEASKLVDVQARVYDRLVFSKVRESFGGRLEYAISGGAAIPIEVAQFIDALGITVYEGYGASETSPIATANWPGSRRMGSVGKPIPGVRIEIDRGGSAEPDGGEIIVYGHNVMQGYHNLPDENAKVLTEDGGFRTGDLGRLDDDGFLHIIGRVKEQYKLANGKYVVPTLIEEKINLSPFVANTMVYGDGREYNIALVALDMEAIETWAGQQGIEAEGHELVNDPQILELIGSEIDERTRGFPRYERIREFALLDDQFTVENGLLTPTLKVKRRIVLERFQGDVERLYG
jgi:long-chain acyl-CoA synthetase